MEYESLVSSIARMKTEDKNSAIIMVEIAIISVFMVFEFQSWQMSLAVFGGLFIAHSIKFLALILTLLINVGWGVVGYKVGELIGGQAAMLSLSLIGLLCGIGVNFSALIHSEDLSLE